MLCCARSQSNEQILIYLLWFFFAGILRVYVLVLVWCHCVSLIILWPQMSCTACLCVFVVCMACLSMRTRTSGGHHLYYNTRWFTNSTTTMKLLQFSVRSFRFYALEWFEFWNLFVSLKILGMKKFIQSQDFGKRIPTIKRNNFQWIYWKIISLQQRVKLHVSALFGVCAINVWTSNKRCTQMLEISKVTMKFHLEIKCISLRFYSDTEDTFGCGYNCLYVWFLFAFSKFSFYCTSQLLWVWMFGY